MGRAGTGRVGVVIPSYNHAAYVGDAVRSVLGQTVDGVELVVIDDGSTDGSAETARLAAREFPDRRATVIEQENRGAHAAIMRGIAELDTPVCAILNSDDLFETDRFERMLPALDGELAIAFSGLTLIDGRGRPLPPDHPWSRWYAGALTAADSEPTIGFALLAHNFSVTSGNFVFTRSLYDRLDGFGEQKFAHDWDFLFRSVALCEPIFVPDRLHRYRLHASNTTESVRGGLRDECERAISRYTDLLERAGAHANPLAPCRSRWPVFWERCAERRPFFAPGERNGKQSWFDRLDAL